MIKPQKQRKRHSPHRPHLCLNKRPVNPILFTMLLMDINFFERKKKESKRIILPWLLSRELLSCATNKTISITVRFQHIQSQGKCRSPLWAPDKC